MKREIKKYLFDIKTSIDSINDYLGESRNFFEYQENKLLRRRITRKGIMPAGNTVYIQERFQ